MASVFGTNLFAFILVLGFLIFAHEAGHFFVAKFYKVQVLVFSFGFGKRLFGFKKGDTDYRVSLIPLGGYVRMAGDMPDMPTDEEYRELEETPRDPHDFLAKPKWQRFLILTAGPGMNLLIALIFLAGLNMVGSEVLRETRPILGEVIPDKPAAKAGLRAGDLVTEANGERVNDWDDLKLIISMNPGNRVNLKYIRAGQPQETIVVPDREVTDYGVTGLAGIHRYLETEVGSVAPGSAAAKAGLKPGDRVVAVNSIPVSQWTDLDRIFDQKAGKPLNLEVTRGNQRVPLVLAGGKTADPAYPGFLPPTAIRKLGPLDALRDSFHQNVKMTKYTFIVIGRLFSFRGSTKDLQGPISIARISGEMLRAGWKPVLYLMASISLQLGIMNLLPVPVLDGGHMAILLVEGVRRRDLSIAVKENIQKLGFAVLAALMIFVLGNDIIQNVMMFRRG